MYYYYKHVICKMYDIFWFILTNDKPDIIIDNENTKSWNFMIQQFCHQWIMISKLQCEQNSNFTKSIVQVNILFPTNPVVTLYKLFPFHSFIQDYIRNLVISRRLLDNISSYFCKVACKKILICPLSYQNRGHCKIINF